MIRHAKIEDAAAIALLIEPYAETGHRQKIVEFY
jgi:N-acetylglutamate synthase-like GNAT family acetyltransferase